MGASLIHLRKAQEVLHRCATKSVDALIIITDHTNVTLWFRNNPQDKVLQRVGVLVFIDYDVSELILDISAHGIIFAENAVRFALKAGEVDNSCLTQQRQIPTIRGSYG